MSDLFVISLGGSLIIPDEIDTTFLKSFVKFIKLNIRKGKKFIIVCGGGKVVRNYQYAARQLSKVSEEDLDWLGIHGTRINAHLLRTIFRESANPRVVKDPTKKILFREKVLIAAAWKPGFSTDYDAVQLAKTYGSKLVINLSNIDYVYTKDPKKYKDAKPIKEISWDDYIKIVGTKWSPGLNAPFDPVASKLAKRSKIKVIIANGRKLNNLNKILSNKKFVGTVIE